MELAKITTFEQLKGELGNELHKAAISFVRIGYLLKLARDGNILAGTSYADVNDFATAEFGLDKTQVSRFIRINDRFSIGGYSEHLKEEYESYGSAKLSLMLTLPDEINQELSPEFSKSDIQAIKEEYDEETKITDIEVMLEERDETLPDEFIPAVVKELNDEHPKPAAYFQETMLIAREMTLEPSVGDAKEAYMPDGDRTYNIRISGQGRFMVNAREQEIKIVNMRAPEEKTTLSWEEFLQVLKEDVAGREFEPEEKEKPEKPEKSKKVEVSRTKREKDTDKKTGQAGKKVEKAEEIVKKEEKSVAEEQKSSEIPEKAEVTPVQPEETKMVSETPEDTNPTETEEAGDKELEMILRLGNLLKSEQCDKIREYSDYIAGYTYRDYRDQLDMISGWAADVKNTTDNLYTILAARGQ
ncbi:MAG: hypothetical protein IJV87_07455 [Clostridia bacterium]|nr:hypothetical protein [Clostridia bacterium]